MRRVLMWNLSSFNWICDHFYSLIELIPSFKSCIPNSSLVVTNSAIGKAVQQYAILLGNQFARALVENKHVTIIDVKPGKLLKWTFFSFCSLGTETWKISGCMWSSTLWKRIIFPNYITFPRTAAYFSFFCPPFFQVNIYKLLNLLSTCVYNFCWC